MQIDVNASSVIGAVVLLLLSIIAYFTKQAFSRLEGVERERTQNALDMATLKKEIALFKEDHERMRKDMQRHEGKIEALVEKFPEMVKQAVGPLFESIKIELAYLKEGINSLK